MNVFQASFMSLIVTLFLTAKFIREHCKGLSGSNQIDLGLKVMLNAIWFQLAIAE